MSDQGPLIITLESALEGDVVLLGIFERYEGGPSRWVGKLAWPVDKLGGWQLFGAALSLGADRTRGHARVEILGDRAVVEALAAREREKEREKS